MLTPHLTLKSHSNHISAKQDTDLFSWYISFSLRGQILVLEKEPTHLILFTAVYKSTSTISRPPKFATDIMAYTKFRCRSYLLLDYTHFSFTFHNVWDIIILQIILPQFLGHAIIKWCRRLAWFQSYKAVKLIHHFDNSCHGLNFFSLIDAAFFKYFGGELYWLMGTDMATIQNHVFKHCSHKYK